MISLRIKVPTKYRWLPDYSIRREIPENWQEVSPKQLLRYCKAQRLAESEAELRILAARYMLPIPWWIFYAVNRFVLARVTSELRWLSSEPLTQNKLPTVRTGLRKLYGPADSLANVRFAEFAVASAYYQAYMANHDPDMLNYLLATLYRTKDGHARPDSLDKRVRFEQHKLSAHVRPVRRLSAEVKMAVLMYFAGCMSELAMRYPLLFAAPDPAVAQAGHRPAQSTGSSDWLDFMRHLPADKFGTLEEIENSLIHPVMEVAHRMMKDSKKEKANQRRQSRNT